MTEDIDWSAVRAYHEELIAAHHARAAIIMQRFRMDYDPEMDRREDHSRLDWEVIDRLRRRILRQSRLATPFEARIFGLSLERRHPSVRVATADVLCPPLGGADTMTLLVPREYTFTFLWPRTSKAAHSLVVLEDRTLMYELAELYRFQEGAYNGGFRHYLRHGTVRFTFDN